MGIANLRPVRATAGESTIASTDPDWKSGGCDFSLIASALIADDRLYWALIRAVLALRQSECARRHVQRNFTGDVGLVLPLQSCRSRKSDPRVVMVQSGQYWHGNDRPNSSS
jgi:hypothetical protein